MKIRIFSTYTIQVFSNYLENEFQRIGIDVKIQKIEYDNFLNSLENDSNDVYFNLDVVIINFFDLFPEEIRNFLSNNEHDEIKIKIENTFNIIENRFKQFSDSILFIEPSVIGSFFEFMDSYSAKQLQKLNLLIGELYITLLDKYIHIQPIFDFEIRKVEDSSFYDRRNSLVFAQPVGNSYLKSLAKKTTKSFLMKSNMSPKIIILDADNTLWGGVIGESHISEIELNNSFPGNVFVEFQKQLLSLKKRGILLAIVSKNNLKDFLNFIEFHPFMVLKKEDFVSIKANWEPKATNIIEIASELKLGLDSVLFIDDSNLEIELVKGIIPEIQVIQIPKNKLEILNILENLNTFNFRNITSEDRMRSESYTKRSTAVLKDNKSYSKILDEFQNVLSLGLVTSEEDQNVLRIHQLINKTNQFNNSGERLSYEDLLNYIREKNYNVFYCKLRDRFGDLGLIGVAITQIFNNKLFVEHFLLSCRSLGRDVETAFLNSVLKNRNSYEINFNFKSNGRNEQVKDFLKNYGFLLNAVEENREFFILRSNFKTPKSLLSNVEWLD
jgi:FkbH-like protein